MIIRKSVEADFAAILAIINEAARAYRGVIPADRWHEPYMPADQLAREITDGVVFWVAEHAERLAGVMGIQDKGDVALVRHAYVVPTTQRTGVGTKLLRHVEGLVDKPILIGTWAAASWAIEFYQRNGFTVVPSGQKDHLLRTYWSIPARQVETSIVLANGRWTEAMSFGNVRSSDDAGTPGISRRSFVAAATAGALGARDIARGDPTGSEAGTIAAPRISRPTFDPWLEVDRTALAHNVRTVARLAGDKPVIAVVKNNAYGLGLETAALLLDSLAAVSHLAVVRADEALTLRKAGARKPILLMGPATEEELLELTPLGVIQSPYRDVAPTLLARVARRTGRPVRVHLYLDTGMHRMGLPVGDALAWTESLSRSRGLRIEGAFTELTEDADFDRHQATRLRDFQATARERGITIPLLHAASSDAIMHQTTETFLDAVRPGLALYGGYVSERAMQRGELRPAYRLKARVVRVDHLAPGEGVSYHRRYTADRSIWTATLAIGHVDGYPSGAVKGCEVFAKGRLFPVIGTVSASHTIVALGDEQHLQVGDEATLVGPDHQAIHPNEVAKRAGWSEYNMFMHLSPKLAKRVV